MKAERGGPTCRLYREIKIIDHEITPKEQKDLTTDYTLRAVDFRTQRNKRQPRSFSICCP